MYKSLIVLAAIWILAASLAVASPSASTNGNSDMPVLELQDRDADATATTDRMERIIERTEEHREEVRERREERIEERVERTQERCAELPEGRRDTCDRLRNVHERLQERCADATSERMQRRCNQDTEEIERLNCDALESDERRALCEHRGNAYGRRYLVSYRHELSNECRNESGQERAGCQRRVNTLFRDEVKERWQSWREEQQNVSDADKNESRRRLHALREELDDEHAEKKEELKMRMNESRADLLDRLDEAIAHTEPTGERMENAIAKAKEKGHDTSELEFLLEEFDTKVDDAKVYFDNEQYRDSLASLKEARKLVREFQHVLKKMVQEHREGRRHAVDAERAFDEESQELEAEEIAVEEGG